MGLLGSWVGTMTDWISYLVLAIVQGVTEFLPVSSSGHLILFNSVFPFDAGILFDLLLHVATLVSVCVFYWKDICQLVVGGCRELGASITKKEKLGSNLWMIIYLVVATLITGVIGLCADDFVSNTLRDPLIVGILLIINAGILWSSRKPGALKTCDGRMNLKTAAIVGLVQGLAVLPGISRSGSTITASLLMGVDAKDCAKFSFLLSIPVILGGFVLHIFKAGSIDPSLWPVFIVSAVVASAVGYGCLKLLEMLLRNAKFYRFAPYCLIVGVLAIVLRLI